MKSDPTVADNSIVRISFDFALQVLAYVQRAGAGPPLRYCAQLLRSATSIGANVREAQHAESRADFTHKCKLAAKEAAETEYWLLLCKHAPSHPEPPATLFVTLLSTQRLPSRMISSSKANVDGLNQKAH